MPEKGVEVKSVSILDSKKVLYSIKVLLIKQINIQATKFADSKADQPSKEIKVISEVHSYYAGTVMFIKS